MHKAWEDVELGIQWTRAGLKQILKSGSSTKSEISAADDMMTALTEIEYRMKKARR